MTLILGSNTNPFIFELGLSGLYLRLPYIGEIAANHVTPFCFSRWAPETSDLLPSRREDSPHL